MSNAYTLKPFKSCSALIRSGQQLWSLADSSLLEDLKLEQFHAWMVAAEEFVTTYPADVVRDEVIPLWDSLEVVIDNMGGRRYKHSLPLLNCACDINNRTPWSKEVYTIVTKHIDWHLESKSMFNTAMHKGWDPGVWANALRRQDGGKIFDWDMEIKTDTRPYHDADTLAEIYAQQLRDYILKHPKWTPGVDSYLYNDVWKSLADLRPQPDQFKEGVVQCTTRLPQYIDGALALLAAVSSLDVELIQPIFALDLKTANPVHAVRQLWIFQQHMLYASNVQALDAFKASWPQAAELLTIHANLYGEEEGYYNLRTLDESWLSRVQQKQTESFDLPDEVLTP